MRNYFELAHARGLNRGTRINSLYMLFQVTNYVFSKFDQIGLADDGNINIQTSSQTFVLIVRSKGITFSSIIF